MLLWTEKCTIWPIETSIGRYKVTLKLPGMSKALQLKTYFNKHNNKHDSPGVKQAFGG